MEKIMNENEVVPDGLTTDLFIEMLEACHINTARVKVYFYMMEHCNSETLCTNASYDKIARETGVSYSTVVKTIKAMQNVNMIEKVGPACWKFTEDIFKEPEDGEDAGFSMYIRNYQD